MMATGFIIGMILSVSRNIEEEAEEDLQAIEEESEQGEATTLKPEEA